MGIKQVIALLSTLFPSVAVIDHNNYFFPRSVVCGSSHVSRTP
jgi:hypothetical protein